LFFVTVSSQTDLDTNLSPISEANKYT